MHPYESIRKTLPTGQAYFDIQQLSPAVAKLPVSIRVLLESAVRNCDGIKVTTSDVDKIINWSTTAVNGDEALFLPARVLMQDFTGVPAVVDLAAMRDACVALGGNAARINPQVPVDLVIDHSVAADFSGTPDAIEKNEALEFERNKERFAFLKWGSKAFDDLRIVPPGFGIVHQVNLEHLAPVAFERNGVVYPDSLVGTDSHTTMINGLGVLGWGVGGIEAESAMLGTPLTMTIPSVVGVKLHGKLSEGVTATDLVLTCTDLLRKHGVVSKFVEFYGPGAVSLSIADRATIANMCPEYGATCGFFPVDDVTLKYLTQTGRSPATVALTEAYYKATGMFGSEGCADSQYMEHLSIDLSTVVPSVSGPKRPQDRVPVATLRDDFAACLATLTGHKGFGVAEADRTKTSTLHYEGKDYKFDHGSVVIAAITSCTNTSNPSVMLGAGLVAKRAVEAGLKVPAYIKTSLAPGSHVADLYLKESGLLPHLETLGFHVVGHGCTTCIGNSGDLKAGVSEHVKKEGMVAAAVLSGNRNFEARVHPDTVANYLASPPLVVAYALAGTMNINLLSEPIGVGKDGKEVFLKDIWPTSEEVNAAVDAFCIPRFFEESYASLTTGGERWQKLEAESGSTYSWAESTYINNPPFFRGMTATPAARSKIENAHVLLYFGDSITTDHISPAGVIAKTSPAAKYLESRGVKPINFNSYGSRRGNDEVMARGTFANTRLPNKLVGEGTTGPVTIHIPTGEKLPIFDAAQRYIDAGIPTIIFAGKEYGSGSSRDWAAKGPMLQGVKAVIAESFERIHRSNLAGMGILPLCFQAGQTPGTLGLKGEDTYTIALPEPLTPHATVTVTSSSGIEFEVVLRLDTAFEIMTFGHGGLLPYVVRQLAKQ